MPPDYNSITRFTDWKDRWKDPSEMDVLQYLNFNIHPEDIILTFALFAPKIVSFEGAFILERNFNEKIFRDLIELDENTIESVEFEMNKVWLFDLFGNVEGEVREETFILLGEVLKESWKNHLHGSFSDKKFEVTFIISDLNYGPIITFNQIDLRSLSSI